VGDSLKRTTPPDAMAFLLMESGKRPMHMGGLQMFTPPEGAGGDFARLTYAAMRTCHDISQMFAGHPVTVGGRTVLMRWTYDDVDLDDHLSYTLLPAPGGEAELFQLISHLHGRILDRRRPLWEVHVIDGLHDGRFAIFTKAHHALFDGVSFLSLLRRSLSTDPHDDHVQVLWSQRPESGAESAGAATAEASWKESVRLIRDAWHERELFPVFRAPRTFLNVRSEVPWVCATQHWPIQRIEAVTRASRTTINDVSLAMCAGALRALLLDRDELPESPLVGLSPVDLRTARDIEGRNVMSSAVCNLGTHLESPAERLATIHASMRYNTQFLRRLPRQVSLYLAGVVGVPITDGARPLPFNVGISHVADARKPLYHNGARLQGTYGFPPTLRGHALNIGLASNAVSLNFAIVGCARVIPDLGPFLDHLEISLKDLERAVGV
jgi:diacylglycerol O-acyltransferase / wax synthase